ncbi:MAG: hypothetical protein WDN28_31460 [Chthoniobacter sp.]
MIAGPVTIATGGILAPGNSPGTLTMGTLTLMAGSILDYQFATPGVVGSGVNDLTEINGSLTLDGDAQRRRAAGFGPGGLPPLRLYRFIDEQHPGSWHPAGRIQLHDRHQHRPPR